MVGTIYGKAAKRLPAVVSYFDRRWKVLGWDGKIAVVTDGRTTLYLTSVHVRIFNSRIPVVGNPVFASFLPEGKNGARYRSRVW